MLRTVAEYCAIALQAAQAAGELLLPAFRTHPVAREKRPLDLVTAWDEASEALIRSRLAAATPELAIVGEERGGEPGALTWYCDPIDGTTNFVHGHPFWCVSIGLMAGDVPLAGAVVAPSLGIEWCGGQGVPASRNGLPCAVSGTRSAHEALLATGFAPTANGAPHVNLQAFERVLPLVRGVRRCGSAAIDVCMVADGTYDAYWERTLNAWDLAGGVAIALSAGAAVTALDGGAANLHVGHLLVSNGHLHEALLPLVR